MLQRQPPRQTSDATLLPPGTRVGGVHLQVSSLARSVAYYQDVIGLQLISMSAHVAVLGAFASFEPLVTLQEPPGTQPIRRRGALGLFHFAILLPDRASLGRFATHLSSLDVQAGMADHSVSEALYLSDPDGLGIEVYADRPRERWTYANGQLLMTTDPLDVDDLVRAAGGSPWTGAPAGATMGHVHLHVGALDRAAAFYRDVVGFEVTMWTYPGALFFAAGAYHHHLGTNTWASGHAPAADQAKLLEWTLALPSSADVEAVGGRLRDHGAEAAAQGESVVTADPWGTRMRIVS